MVSSNAWDLLFAHELLVGTEHLKSNEVSAQTPDEQTCYLDPMISLVQVFLRVGKYARQPDRIGEDLRPPALRLEEILAFLKNQGFIHWDVARKAYRVDKHTRYLDPASPVCRPHQIMMQLKSLQRMSELGPNDRYTLSITYFADDRIRRKVKAEFLEFLKRIEGRTGEIEQSGQDSDCGVARKVRKVKE